MTMPRLRAGFLILVLGLAGAALSFAASSYKVTLPSDLMVGGTKLKSGEYSISIEGRNAVFKRDKQSIPIPVDVEKNSEKFSRTTLEVSGTTLRIINLGGTDTMLVFPPPR
jgi:hypothetical protein